MTKARSAHPRKVTVPALLASASLIALLAGMPQAAAEDCTTQAAPPANLATPSMVYETLSARTNAQMLAMGFLRKPVDEACAWVYEVRLMTASGSVVELDFNADGLGIIGARGPQDDRDAVDLVKTLGGDATVLTVGTKEDGRGKGPAAGSSKGSGKGSGGDGGDDGGDGGSGSDHSGSGDGGDGGGDGGSSGSGGGGDSGSDGGGDDGGHDGDGGGSGDGGDGGGDD